MDKIIIRKVEKVVTDYIPKHTTCRFEEQKRQISREKDKKEIIEAIEKVENPVSVKIDIGWQPESPDMSVCRVCKETIYSTQYKLAININGENIQQSRPPKLCEPCYSLL
jgi:hypothetical protein